MIDQLLSAFVLYGLPLLFVVVLLASVCVPLPVGLVLITAGSFAKQGEMELVSIIIVAGVAAISGDQIGYGLSRWGGRRLIDRITRRIGGAKSITKAEALSKRWGWAGIFFSRWLVTELGPWINITSGITGYPWRHFTLWSVLGEVLWVVLYVTMGYLFSDRVQDLMELLGNFALMILGLIVALILGWKVMRYFRPAVSETA